MARAGLSTVLLLVVALNSCISLAAAPLADAAKIEDPELRACMQRMEPQHSATQKLAVAVSESGGAALESNGSLNWKRGEDGLSKLLVHVDNSSQYAGVAILMLERKAGSPDVYMYSPEMGRDRRIASSALAGPLLGTDFTYEDFAFLQHVFANGQIARGPDADLDGHAAYVLQTVPEPDTSAYSRIQTTLDKETCVPMTTEFFGPNGTLVKQLVIERKDIGRSGDRAVPQRMTMTNLKQNSHTVLTITDPVFDAGLDDGLFTPAALRRKR